MAESTLESLACALASAKTEESKAKATRINIEEDIASLVETSESGSKTVDAGNGLKVTVKRALGYKADMKAIMNMDLPENSMPIVLTPQKWEFDKKEYERIIAADPDSAAKLAQHVTVTPRKVSVTLKIG